MMIDLGVSFVPIVTADNQVTNIYSRNDIMLLGKDTTGSMHLDLPISEVLRLQIGQGISGEIFQMCSCTDTLHSILEMFFVSKVGRPLSAANFGASFGASFALLPPISRSSVFL
jgi:hypothetical protein